MAWPSLHAALLSTVAVVDAQVANTGVLPQV